jgi:tripartite-type tricarboxylate transporter receptor subunit TctC
MDVRKIESGAKLSAEDYEGMSERLQVALLEADAQEVVHQQQMSELAELDAELDRMIAEAEVTLAEGVA